MDYIYSWSGGGSPEDTSGQRCRLRFNEDVVSLGQMRSASGKPSNYQTLLMTAWLWFGLCNVLFTAASISHYSYTELQLMGLLALWFLVLSGVIDAPTKRFKCFPILNDLGGCPNLLTENAARIPCPSASRSLLQAFNPQGCAMCAHRPFLR